MSSAVSPFAPARFPDLPAIPGVRMATAQAGIKYPGRTDVLLMAFDPATTVAGVFTRSKCPSAAVDWCRANVGNGTARALLVNSGNANAFTGKKGLQAVTISGDLVGEALSVPASDVFLASTGVIGEPLDPSKFEAVLGGCVEQLAGDGWELAGRAIMTTDTYPKGATRTADVGGVTVTINGIAKGAGMIAPDMATMLSFIATDAAIAPGALQRMLQAGVKDTFNAITIDSDTSTSDTVLLFATGAAGNAPIESATSAAARRFRAALNEVLEDLAHQVVKDGEGARKFVTVTVEGAQSAGSARTIARSIANSPLVKTAIAGEDANWGRVVMAVGKAGEPAERDKLAIWFGDVRVAVEGERDPDYSEDAASEVMQQPEITIRVDLGIGRGSGTVWTCDLTKEYVAINGDYRS